MTRKNLPALSPSETEILRLVWQLEKATVQEVCEKLPAKRKITYATVQTLLRRLEKKGPSATSLIGSSAEIPCRLFNT